MGTHTARPDPAEGIEAPLCDGGYTRDQVIRILGEGTPALDKWMTGQTMMLCTGEKYNHDTKAYEPGCGPHGPVVYGHDLRRFLRGLPVID